MIDFIGVGGLGEIVESAQLHRRHGRDDIAIAREDDAARLGTPRLQLRDHVETVAVLQAHVDDGEGGRLERDGGQPLGDGLCGHHGEAARLHGPAEAGEEGLVVVDDEQTAVIAHGERQSSSLLAGEASKSIDWRS